MLRKFFVSPVFADDEEKTRIAGLLNTILLTHLFVAVVPVVNFLFTPGSGPITLALLLAFLLPLIGMLYFMRRGFVRPVSIGLVVFLLITAGCLGVLSGGKSQIIVTYYPLIIVISGLLLGANSAVTTALISSIVFGSITYAGTKGILYELLPPPPLGVIIFTYAIGFILIGIVLHLASRGLDIALRRAREGEKQLLHTNRELQELSTSLEQIVRDRTNELARQTEDLEHANQSIQSRANKFEAVAQVAQAISSVRDLKDVLPLTAGVISNNFGFYHVGIFLLDEVNEYAVLSATNSVGGEKMMARKHRLKVGEQGIVGNVTRTGVPRIAMDVGEDAVFFNNLELPDTHSEMALPLKSGNQIIGALDVQSTQRGAFVEEDIQLLSLLANQVSLAIENARLFDETRRALAESEAVIRQSTREAWRSLPVEQNLLGYRYTLSGASPLVKAVELSDSKKTETSQIVVPIQLHGEVIGNLVVQSSAGGDVSQDQLDLIKAVAERVAISAENARLFDETTRRAERERTVSDITSKIRSVNNPQAMIQTAIEELRNALGASRVEVIPQTIKGTE
jgi:GAF domain-containing protein